MPVLNDLIATNVATAGSINDKLIEYFSGIYRGSGSPEGVVNAPLGSTYQDVVTPAMYLKSTATGTLTGWVLFADASGATDTPPVNGKVATAGTIAFGTGVTGDAQANRWTVGGDGKQQWGSGALALDTNLYRFAANQLKTDGFLEAANYVAGAHNAATETRMGAVGPASESGISFQTAEFNLYRSGSQVLKTEANFTTLRNLTIRESASNQVIIGNVGPAAEAALTFGSASDTNLFRSAADTLKTSDSLHVATGLGVGTAPPANNDARILGRVGAAFGTATQTSIGDVGPSSQSGILFGSALDTNLYRSAADVLRTDDAFVAGGTYLAIASGSWYAGNPITYAGAASSGGSVLSFGTGAPANASGTDGDLYLRKDGGALTTIYQRRAGAWVGIV